MVMVPVLTIVCDVVAISGGWVIAHYIAHVSSTVYWTYVIDKLNFGNMTMGLIKPICFSFVIAFIACYKGFTAEGGTKGVGQATTHSVMLTSITILIVNFFITKIVGSMLRGYYA